MKKIDVPFSLLLLIVGASQTSLCVAQNSARGLYVGLASADFDYEGNIDGAGKVFDESALATSLYGGYRLTDHWGVEGAWSTTGAAKRTATGAFYELNAPPAPPRTSTITVAVEVEAISLYGIGYFPLSWGALFVGLGYFESDTDLSLESDDGISVNRIGVSGSNDGLTVIGGAQWDLSSVSIRMYYEQREKDRSESFYDSADTTSLGIGVHWRF